MQLDVAKIQEQVAARGWTLTKLAEEAGLSRQMVSAIVSRGTCSIKNAGKLATALGIEFRQISREG